MSLSLMYMLGIIQVQQKLKCFMLNSRKKKFSFEVNLNIFLQEIN
jgi:hypothetical protein